MNRIFQSVWNDTTGTFVAASEITTSTGKKPSPVTTAMAKGERFVLKALAASVMIAFGANVHALPVGGVVTEGAAGISGTANSTTITQSSQNVAINWQSFNIGATEAVQFVQPNSSSVALNRVLGPDPSSIFGSLSANGKVFLVNPHGVLFARGAQVNVGGLVASTLNISDSDFMAGRYQFAGNSSAAVLNQGTINADGGSVALLGANVGNDGVIVARLGTVALAAGDAVTLDVAGDGLLSVTVSQGAVNALVQNGGLIHADGGQVLLTAMAAGDLLQSAVNNTGVIQARTIENHNGTIRLLGDMRIGTANVAGTLDASAPNGGDGGFIEASAARVNISSDVHITTAAPMGLTGTFLIDPQDFTVGSALGDNITGAVLGALLVTNSVIISTDIGVNGVVAGVPPVSSLFSPTGINGDIFITEFVTWVTGGIPTTLTLNAARDVNIGRNSLGAIIPTATINATGGNLVVCCGRDINVEAAITTAGAGGSVLLSAGNNVNLNAAISATNGNVTLCAGNNVNLMGPPAAITLIGIAPAPALSLGLADGLVLSGGTNGSGAGTVNFSVGTPPVAMTNAPVNIYYNPVNYTTPTDYSTAPFFTLVGGLSTVTEYMLVFPDGANKSFDGSTATTFTGLKGSPAGVTLNPGAIPNFDTAAVGANKTVNFTGWTLTQGPILPGGVDINYAFANSCCGPAVARTTATIIAALPPVPPVPTVVVPEALPEEMMGPEVFAPGALFAIEPRLMPRVELAGFPPQLLSIAPVPVIVPPPRVVEEPQPIYVPPLLPRKQDRN